MSKIINKHLVELSNGKPCKFSPPFTKGKQSNWYMTYDRPSIWKAADEAKGRQYKLNLWSSRSDFHLIAADFDQIPSGFSSFDDVATFHKTKYMPNEAVVSRSASNKVKVFFLVELPPNMKISAPIAIEALRVIYLDQKGLFDSLDLAPQALSVTYLSRGVLEALVPGVSLLSPILDAKSLNRLLLEDSGWYNSSGTAKPTAVSLRTYSGSLDGLLQTTGINPTKLKFIRILLESTQLTYANGFGISPTKIAAQLGVSRRLINAYRAQLEGSGWLVLAEGKRHFIPGKKAIRFKAAGALAEALNKLGKKPKPVHIPKKIETGRWNESLRSIVAQLYLSKSIEEIVDIVGGIEGADEGSRMKQAIGWYRYYKNRNLTNTKVLTTEGELR